MQNKLYRMQKNLKSENRYSHCNILALYEIHLFEILHVGHKMTNNMYNIINTVSSGHFIVNDHMLSSMLLQCIILSCCYFLSWTQGQLNF